MLHGCHFYFNAFPVGVSCRYDTEMQLSSISNEHTLNLNVIPPKFNTAPEKWWLEDYFPVGKVTFQWLC